MARSYVLGAGGIGLFLAYILNKVTPTTVIARQHTVDVLAREPLRVSGKIDGEMKLDAKTLEQVESFEEGDIVYVSTKAHELEGLLSALKAKLKPGSSVALCQNGIGIFDIGRALLPHVHILRLNCWLGATRKELNELKVAGYFKLDLSAETDTRKQLQEVQAALEATGYKVEAGTAPHLSEWRKALWNITVNGMCAIVDAKNGAILDYPELKAIADLILDETRRVAHGAGVMISQEDLDKVFQSLEQTRENINATLQDLRAGRHPELEFLNGAVVNAARKNDQNAPLNETILNLVTYLEKVKARRKD